jgi:GNAT superfamily N-acetyltransferase
VAARIEVRPDREREEALEQRLVEHNKEASSVVRLRFRPENLRTRSVQAFALDDNGALLGGCVGRTVDVWGWLTIDTLWVDRSHRRRGLGRQLVEAVEDQARRRGCQWSKLNTWEFQAPEFYARLGYVIYGSEIDYPPGHTNYLMRKTL